MIDDLLFDMLYDNSFEMIFWNYYHSLKKDCADRPFEIIFFSISGQHNHWKQFSMLYVLKWYMTFICKWGGKIFVHKIIFVRKNQIFYWRKYLILYIFRTQLFTQGIVSLSLRWNKFFKKGDGLLCQILMILQC